MNSGTILCFLIFLWSVFFVLGRSGGQSTCEREEESEDDIGNRPTKKVKGKGKAPAEGEKKFRLSEMQTVTRGIDVGKSD